MKRASCLFCSTLLAFAFCYSYSSADVVLTFDNDTQGFGNVGWNSDNGSVEWSSFNGGSLRINFTTDGGWTNPLGVMSMTNVHLGALFPQILANGGTLTFDYFVAREDLAGYDPDNPPGWFELVLVGNSDADVGGGWDQNVIGGDAGFYGGIPEGYTQRQVAVGLGAGPPSTNDDMITWGVGSGWNDLLIGLNFQGGSLTSGHVYIDNMRFTAIPEPGSVAVGAFLVVGLFMRRKR